MLDASSINVDEVHEEKTVLMFLTVEEVNFDFGKRERQWCSWLKLCQYKKENK